METHSGLRLSDTQNWGLSLSHRKKRRLSGQSSVLLARVDTTDSVGALWRQLLAPTAAPY